MDRAFHLGVFLVLALFVLVGMNRYVWVRLVRDVALPRPWRLGATVFVVLAALAVPIVFTLARRHSENSISGATGLVWSWFGFVFYAFLIVACADLVLLVVRFVRKRTSAEPGPPASAPSAGGELDRRTLLSRAVAGAAALGAGGTTFAGRRAVQDVTTPVVEVELARLPPAFDGFKIAHLSDVHFGPQLGEHFLDEVLRRVRSLEPDLIVITGDLVDGSVARLGPRIDRLRELAAPHGVFFSTGNHEYYSDANAWIAWLEERKIRVLLNTRVEVEKGGARFDLAGIPDRDGAMFGPEHAVDLARALAGRDPSRELVLLAHRPSQVDLAAEHGVGLQLSGHTHGGQLWPFGALVRLAEPYVAGLHRHGERTQIYVSRGTGFWGPPLRVANPAEIACIVLRAPR
ncbi:MAG: metallophosphoesterase [Planctomycetes bacterium]|nr:metallophosphoesterase [Planctomycetota bacterium]